MSTLIQFGRQFVRFIPKGSLQLYFNYWLSETFCCTEIYSNRKKSERLDVSGLLRVDEVLPHVLIRPDDPGGLVGVGVTGMLFVWAMGR